MAASINYLGQQCRRKSDEKESKIDSEMSDGGEAGSKKEILSLDERKQILGQVFPSISPGKKTDISKRLNTKERIGNFLENCCLLNVCEGDEFR